jgi:Na+-driven multidrug efflux pump
MRMPSAVLGAGALIQMVLGAVLTLGWGPIPRLGIVGAAIAYLAGFGLAALVLGILAVRELRSWSIPLRVPAPQWPLLKEILRVGLLSSLNAAQTVFTALIVTGLVGSYGTAALAGYGVGVRLELLQVPFVFAIGAALVAAVGMNVGAGNMARARRVAWTGGAVGAAITGSVGLIVALRPHWWTGMFSSDPAVLASGYAYLQIAGPCYGFLGFGMAAYFASQGAGRVLGPVLASSARLLIAALGGYLAVHWIGGELTMLYSLIGLSLVVFGLGGALAIARSIFR